MVEALGAAGSFPPPGIFFHSTPLQVFLNHSAAYFHPNFTASLKCQAISNIHPPPEPSSSPIPLTSFSPNPPSPPIVWHTETKKKKEKEAFGFNYDCIWIDTT